MIKDFFTRVLPDTTKKVLGTIGGWIKEELQEAEKNVFEDLKKSGEELQKNPVYRDDNGVGKAVVDIGKAVIQGTAQSGGSVALTLMGKEELSDEELESAHPGLLKAKKIIYGDDPLRSIQKRIAIAKQDIEEKGGVEIPFTTSKIPVKKELAGPLSTIGVIGMIGLDFTGWGGGKSQVIKQLSKADKIGDVTNIIRKTLTGVDEKVVKKVVEKYGPTLVKLTTEDDVAKVLTKIDDVVKGSKATAIPTKTRKFLESVKEAKPDVPIKVGTQYIPRSTDDLAIKARNLIVDDIDMAEQIAKTGTDDKAIATAAELIKHYTDEALKSTSKATKNTLLDKASDLAHLTAENLTELGRSVQAASIMGRLTPEGMLRFAAREINKYNEAVLKSKGLFGLKKKIPNLTPEMTETILKEYKNIEKLEDGAQKAIAFKALTDKIGELIPSPLFKKLISVWKAGLLTGIKTSGLNTMSNLFHGVSETIKDVPATAIDSVASLFTGKRTVGLTVRGVKEGVEEGFKKGWRYLKTGYDERNVAAKLDYHKVNFGKGKLAKGIQKYEETIFHILGAEDQPFYYAAKARSLQSQAIAMAKNAGKKGAEAKAFIEKLVDSPTDEMIRYATNDAEIAVFQNPTVLGKIAKAIQKAPGGEFVVPFGKTPSAVATQFVNYTPVGIVKTIIQNIGKGKFDQRLFSQGLARGLTGTGIMYLGSELFKKGMINLDRPKNEREQKLWEAEGRTPNSIKLGGKWRNINVLGPAGYALITGANFRKFLKEGGSPFKAMMDATAGGVKSLSEQTFLQGLRSILDALNDPSRFFEGYFANTAASFIPTIVSDLAKSFDEVERRSPEVLDRIKARIPGFRQTLEPQVDVLGNERLKGGNFIETMIDPSRPSNIIDSPVADELRRITDAGFNVSPTQLGDKDGYKGLEPEENTMIWKKAGELINEKLSKLFTLKQYEELDDEEKAKAIEAVVEKSKLVARVQAVMELTDELSGDELKNKLKELKESGLMTKQVFEEYLKLK
ncbi:MAG: putative structural protein [Siphoviridae sp. cttb18]|nr:MAG: putative structural protein [Siphoviridae sp. cttb18]